MPGSGARGVDLSVQLRNGAEFLRRGQLQAARQALEKAVRSEPNSLDGLQLLGIVLSELGEHDTALHHLRRAVTLDPTRASTRFNLAKALHLAGRLDGALAAFEAARSLAPRAAQIHLGLGNLQLDLGLDDRALASYTDATRCAPGMADAHLNLGKVLASQDQHAAALQAFERVLSLEPNDVDALFGKAASQQALGDWTNYDDRVARCIDLARRGTSPSGATFLLIMLCDDNEILHRAAKREIIIVG